MAGIVFYQR